MSTGPRAVLTADLHGSLPSIEPCDLLLIAGDVCPFSDHDPEYQRGWIANTFSPWLRECPADHVVWIAGNHDFVLERIADGIDPPLEEIGPNIHHLCDESIEVAGLTIHGLPWSLFPHPGWAFTAAEDSGFEDRIAAIPDGVDVVLSHGPPLGFGDDTVSGVRAGSKALLDRVTEVRPSLTVFGHIHEGYGVYESDGLELINVSQMNVAYEPVNPPVVRQL